jgi:hypothetical protein
MKSRGKSSEPRYRVAAHVETRRVAGTTIVTEHDGTYFELDPVGSTIWEAVSTGIRMDDLVDRVAVEFGVDRDTAASDLAEFLARLSERGLIEPA